MSSTANRAKNWGIDDTLLTIKVLCKVQYYKSKFDFSCINMKSKSMSQLIANMVIECFKVLI